MALLEMTPSDPKVVWATPFSLC